MNKYSLVFWFWIQLNESFFMKGDFLLVRIGPDQQPRGGRKLRHHRIRKRLSGCCSGNGHLLWPSTRWDGCECQREAFGRVTEYSMNRRAIDFIDYDSFAEFQILFHSHGNLLQSRVVSNL